MISDPMILVLSPPLIAAAIFDLRSKRIPNFITIPGIIAAVVYSAVSGNGFTFGIAGVGVGVGLLVIPWLLGGMGAGDAKLMGVVGGFLGARGVLNAFLIIAIVGGLYAVGLYVIHKEEINGSLARMYRAVSIFLLTRQFSLELERTNETPKLCYGVAIALGTFVHIALNECGISII